MLPETHEAAFKNFYELSRDNTILDTRTSLLIGLVSAMAFGCYP